MRGRLPDNYVFSHDLFKRGRDQTALVTDMVLIKGYPLNDVTWMGQLQHWIRGEWQLLPYLRSVCPLWLATGVTRGPHPPMEDRRSLDV